MSRDSKDDRTPDLLSWQPPEVAPSFREEEIRAATLRDRLARAVARTLRDAGVDRSVVAERMGEFLDEKVPGHALDGYASQAQDERTISAIRLIALLHATGDMRPLQALIDGLDYAVIPKRYIAAIEEALLDDQIEQLSERRQIARRRWKAPRK